MRQNSQRRSGLYSSRYLQEREKFLVNFNLAINKYCYLISQTERDKKFVKKSMVSRRTSIFASIA